MTVKAKYMMSAGKQPKAGMEKRLAKSKIHVLDRMMKDELRFGDREIYDLARGCGGFWGPDRRLLHVR